ncbi:very short patch repair endonuclease [bacterium]|nr:very short patch repair endonuclease [bacterium]
MAKLNSNKKRSVPKAGHRSWAPFNAPVPGIHRGDIMSTEKRSKVMSKIEGKNTSPERIIFALLEENKIPFSKHVETLQGRPDIVFHEEKVAVFIDGDFWHGWRFPLWEHKLSEKWREKITATRKRDQRNFRRLRKLGWRVVRIWEHEIEHSSAECLEKIVNTLKARQSALT